MMGPALGAGNLHPLLDANCGVYHLQKLTLKLKINGIKLVPMANWGCHTQLATVGSWWPGKLVKLVAL